MLKYFVKNAGKMLKKKIIKKTSSSLKYLRGEKEIQKIRYRSIHTELIFLKRIRDNERIKLWNTNNIINWY